MYRKEVNEHSPMRVFERSIHGGLGAGNLGVVMSRAGIGKTAFLVQIGLDELMRDRKVLHVSLASNIERVQSWYEELFADLSRFANLDKSDSTQVMIDRNRMIQAYPDHKFNAEKLRSVMAVLKEHAGFHPSTILVDGLDWEHHDANHVPDLKALASEYGAELWTTARTHREETGADPVELPEFVRKQDEVVDVAVFLQPHASHVDLRLLKDHDRTDFDFDSPLKLDPYTMRLVDPRDTSEFPTVIFDRDEYTIFSGGAPGTESAFGEVADFFGIREVNFSFLGHEPARQSGLRELSDRELRQGDVSLAYVSKRMGRSFTQSPTFRRVLQTIWHQVNNSQQVLVIGTIQADGTVKGGTGWGAELARVWNKPVWVFDQEKRSWFRWDGLEEKWVVSTTPRLIAANFCGTGTRFLTEDGRAAIRAVFDKTFTPA